MVTAERMIELAAQQPGFLAVDSAKQPGGLGLTVSYWLEEADILAWGRVSEHRLAQNMGHRKWHRSDTLRTCRAWSLPGIIQLGFSQGPPAAVR